MNDFTEAAPPAPAAGAPAPPAPAPPAPRVPAPSGHAGDHDRILLSLIRAAHAIEEKLETELAAAGLSGAKLRILSQLAQAGSPLAISQLADAQRCVRSNITQILDRLETEGLVRRVDDPVDGRVVRAQLTARGKERQTRGAEIFRAVQAEIAASLPPADRESLERALAALSALSRNTAQGSSAP